MAYSPAPLALDRSKPSPWNVEGAFVAPEYQGLWRGLYGAIPFWSSSGDPFDIVGRALKNRVGSPVWTATTHGPALTLNGSSQYVTAKWRTLGPQLGQSAATFVVRLASSAKGVLAGAINDGSDTLVQVFVNTNSSESQQAGFLNAHIRGEGGNQIRVGTTAATGIDDGAVHVVTFTFDTTLGEIHIYMDGREIPVTVIFNDTNATYADFEYDLTVGARNVRGVIDNYLDGDLVFAGWHTFVPSAVQVRSWHADPFGLFRPNWDYVTVGFDPANLQASVLGSDVTLTWDV